jgi:hypothetical protein
LQLAAPADILPQEGKSLEVLIRPAASRWTAGPQATVLVGGWTRSRDEGGRSGGAVFFDGANWRTDDLSPSDPAAQTGRLFVELRVRNSAGTVREVWY